MKKIIILGVFLFSLTLFLLLGLHPGVSDSSKSVDYVIEQKTYTADSQAMTTDAVSLNDADGYVHARKITLSGGKPKEEIVINPSIPLQVSKDEVNSANAGTEKQLNARSKEMGAAAVSGKNRIPVSVGYMPQPPANKDAGNVTAPDTGDVLPGNPAIKSPEALPVVGSYENLKALLEMKSSFDDYGGGMLFPGVSFVVRSAMPVSMAFDNAVVAGVAQANAVDYSVTNVQVEGVDEADIVKTDGTYIYQVNRERIVIIKAVAAEKMEIAGVLDYADKSFSPQEIYVDEDHLIVIGRGSRDWSYPTDKRIGGIMPMFMPSYFYPREMVKAVIYDIRNKSDIRQVRELELNGSYVSSRKTGQSLYLVANKHLYYCRGGEINEPKPSYHDSVIGEGFAEIDYADIKYFPDSIEPSYLILAGLNLDCPDDAASVSGYLGSGQNVFASTRNLYVTVTSYSQSALKPVSAIGLFRPADIVNTKIYKFGLRDGRLTYLVSGKAPGTVLNQFSMDENGKYFRIATTKGNAWGSGEDASKNNVYIFDDSMDIAGKLEDMAPGERIYSVRFIGDRAYMVTFRNVDPFFVLDLKDPRHPAILGELKIPGYSDYLHPYDENHVIGFGKDAVDIWGMSFYLGMKMAIFDVSDVRRPVEMFTEKIGDRGTDSEILRNPKALLFSKDRNLMAFPVRLMEVKDSGQKPDTAFPEYGSFKFQGAFVYGIDLVNGFVKKGTITHLSNGDFSDANKYWYDCEKYVVRIIYIDDTLFTLSNGMIKVNGIHDLQEIDSLEIK